MIDSNVPIAPKGESEGKICGYKEAKLDIHCDTSGLAIQGRKG